MTKPVPLQVYTDFFKIDAAPDSFQAIREFGQNALESIGPTVEKSLEAQKLFDQAVTLSDVKVQKQKLKAFFALAAEVKREQHDVLKTLAAFIAYKDEVLKKYDTVYIPEGKAAVEKSEYEDASSLEYLALLRYCRFSFHNSIYLLTCAKEAVTKSVAINNNFVKGAKLYSKNLG